MAPDNLPPPDLLQARHDQQCPACRTMLRHLSPMQLGYTADTVRHLLRSARAQEREIAAQERDRAEKAEAERDALRKALESAVQMLRDIASSRLAAIDAAKGAAGAVRTGTECRHGVPYRYACEACDDVFKAAS